MKKLVLTFIVAVTALFMGNALYGQTELQSATLQQGDKTTVFYGADAFVKAFNAVKDSADVITLSAGSFRSTNINKACSIYGSGYERIDSIGLYPTILDDIAVLHGTEKDDEGNVITKQGDLDGLHMEGIWINNLKLGDYNATLTIKNLTIKRCRFANRVDFDPDSYHCINYNTNIINCIINSIDVGYGGRNLSIYNSIINDLQGVSSIKSYNVTALIKNCLIFRFNSIYATFKDNLLSISTNASTIYSEYAASSYYQNNLSSIDLFSNKPVSHNYNNWVSKSHLSIFGIEIGNEYNPQYTYELKPGNETIYVGTDGTQVGLYGGLYPFTKIPSNPQIISKEIDTNTTVDGKLKVSIKVKAQE